MRYNASAHHLTGEEEMPLLLVEDDAALARALVQGLHLQGYTVEAVGTAEEARHALAVRSYDALILDLRLPDGHGLDLCRWVRQQGLELPILILTALDEPQTIVEGLDAGADDYVVKPVDLDVLAARLRALLRRHLHPKAGLWRAGDLVLDPARRQAYLAGEPLPLTRKEFAILEYLMRHPGRVISTEELLEHIWGEPGNLFTHTVRTHIYNLRRKLRDPADHPRFIETLPGQGYRLRVPETEAPDRETGAQRR